MVIGCRIGVKKGSNDRQLIPSQNLLKNVDLLVISLPKVSLEACSDGCISLSL